MNLLTILVILLAANVAHSNELPVHALKCEYLAHAQGIQVSHPRFSWVLKEGRQTAYQVVVREMWDSGKVLSDQSIGIPYAGRPFESGKEYSWKVRVWDGVGKSSGWSKPSTFSTGLHDWKAKWIAAIESSGVGVLGMAVESTVPNVHKWVQIDLGKEQRIDRIVLQPQYHNDPAAGGWTKGYGFPIRFRLDLSNSADFAQYKTVADRTDIDFKNPGLTPVAFDVGNERARYVRLTVTKLWHRGQGLPFVYTLAAIEVMSGNKDVALGKQVSASESVEAYGWSMAHITDGRIQRPPTADLGPNPHAAVLLRKEVTVGKPVKRATVYMSGLGWSELSLNGKKVGDEVLSPEFTDYDKRVPYVVHDVTAVLRPGPNALGVTLGNGFSATPGLGYLQWYGNGGAPRLLLQLNIEFTDGSQRSIVTDDSWKWSTGEIIFNDLWQGERIDHRLAKSGWDRPGYGASDWHPALVVSAPRGKLFARRIPPIRVLETAQPIKVEGNRFTFDALGAGWLRLKTIGQAGDKVVVNYRADRPTSGWSPEGLRIGTECILKGGGEEQFEPKFLFHTIDRVITIDGLKRIPTKDTLTRVSAQIDLDRVGSFRCSSDFLNKQYEALLRTQRNYNYDYPMDPTREKSGWTQDVMTMINSSVYDFDSAAFYWNWWQSMCDNQRSDGYLGSVVPLVNRVLDDCNCVWWSGMVIYTPWKLYEYYGDRRFIEESYPVMESYMNWLATKADKDRIVSWGLGDWLEVGVGSAPERTSVPITSTCGYYLYATILSRSAELLGKHSDAVKYANLARDIKEGFNRRFLNDKTGQIGANPDSQTALVLPLYLDMIPQNLRGLVTSRLIANIHERRDHLSTGFIGTLHLLLGLPELGEAELTHKIVMQQDFPGWNTLVHDGVQMETWAGGQVQMPSLGGPIGAYLYQVLAGIRPASPGFKRILIKPAIVGDLTWVQAHFDSPYGRIESSWKRQDSSLTMDVTIPANTTASVVVPGVGVHEVGPGHHRFSGLVLP